MLIQATDITYLIANDCAIQLCTVCRLMSVSDFVAHSGITEDKIAAI